MKTKPKINVKTNIQVSTTTLIKTKLKMIKLDIKARSR